MSSDPQSIVTAALEVSKRRAAVLERMRTALETNDTLNALEYARELCGLKTNETSNRVN